MRSNKQRLGDEISGRMVRTAAASVQTCVELGVIGAGLTLTTDSIKSAIPKDQYMVDIRMTGTQKTKSATHTHDDGKHRHAELTSTTPDGAHTHSGGDHSHEMPSGYRGLKSGDRVLVVWAGNEPVVVAIVCSGAKLN